jgi:hypothetical protein
MIQKTIHDKDLQWVAAKIGGCGIHGPWIAGGAARRLWFGENWKESDVDIFFPSPESFYQAKEALDKRPLIDTMLLVKKPKKLHESTNAITYDVQIGRISVTQIRIQLIKNKWYSSLDELFYNFDFTVCQFASDGSNLFARDYAVNDALGKVLKRTAGKMCPLHIKRVIKYNLYGFLADTDITRELSDSYKDRTLLEATETDDTDYD